MHGLHLCANFFQCASSMLRSSFLCGFVKQFFLVTQTRFPIPSMYGASAVSFGEKLYVLGGMSFNKVQKHVILWDGSIFFKVQPLTIGRLLCVFVCGEWGGLGVGVVLGGGTCEDEVLHQHHHSI
jgi:hypothetical protein